LARWKIPLKKRNYSPESTNHYLSAVQETLVFAEKTELIDAAPILYRQHTQQPYQSSYNCLQLLTRSSTYRNGSRDVVIIFLEQVIISPLERLISMAALVLTL